MHVKFVQPDGAAAALAMESGASVMITAVRNGIRGIDGECGGCLDCATCHVYVEESQSGNIPAPTADELELLGTITGLRRPNSRLSCQIKAPLAIDTLVVHIPESQA